MLTHGKNHGYDNGKVRTHAYFVFCTGLPRLLRLPGPIAPATGSRRRDITTLRRRVAKNEGVCLGSDHTMFLRRERIYIWGWVVTKLGVQHQRRRRHTPHGVENDPRHIKPCTYLMPIFKDF